MKIRSWVMRRRKVKPPPNRRPTETITALEQRGFTVFPTGNVLGKDTYQVVSPRDDLGRRWSGNRNAEDLIKILANEDTYFANHEG